MFDRKIEANVSPQIVAHEPNNTGRRTRDDTLRGSKTYKSITPRDVTFQKGQVLGAEEFTQSPGAGGSGVEFKEQVRSSVSDSFFWPRSNYRCIDEDQ